MTESSQDQKQGQKLHTYVRRRGRITSAQQRGYDYAKSGLAYQEQELLTRIASKSPIGVEIGFGMGHALAHWAEEAPEWLLVGIELYQPGIGSLAQMAERAALKNLRIVEQSAQEFCATLPDHSLNEVRIYFPDPWPKKRHFKRRLIQVEFVHELHRVLVPGGIVRLASDWEPYAQWIRECFAEVPTFVKLTDSIRDGEPTDEPASTGVPEDEGDTQVRPVTKFERRGERLGHAIHDLSYVANEP